MVSNLIEISSKDNATIKEYRKLKEKKYRNEQNKFIIEGFRFVEESIKAKAKIDCIFIDEKYLDKLNTLYEKHKIKDDIKTYVVNDKIIKTLTDTQNPQGIVAVIDFLKKDLLENKNGFYILVDKVQDPGNMGTIIRTAHASGALGVIVTKGTVDVYNEKTLRSTMGSIFYVPIIYDNSFEFINNLKKKNFKLVVSSLQTSFNFYDIDMKQDLIITVGNEGNGVSDEILSLSDIKIKIPMPGGAESLNVAVACSIMVFEGIRQRNL